MRGLAPAGAAGEELDLLVVEEEDVGRAGDGTHQHVVFAHVDSHRVGANEARAGLRQDLVLQVGMHAAEEQHLCAP